MSQFNPTNYPTVTPAALDLVLIRRTSDGAIKTATVSSVAGAIPSVSTVGTIAELRALAVDGIATGALGIVAGYFSDGDGGGGNFYFDAASGAADNDGTIIAPDSGDGRWIRDFSGSVNVRWFGAMGDAANDDATAIQATISYVQSSGGAVYIPTGVYLIGSGLVINAGDVSIYGDGVGATKIRTNFAALSVFTIGGAGGVKIEEVSISELEIQSNVTHTAGAVFNVFSAKSLRFHDITAGSYFRLAILGNATYADDVQQVYFRNIRYNAVAAPNHAIQLVSGAIAVISDCMFNGTGGGTHALIAQTTTTRNWDGLVIEGCTAEQWPYHIYTTGAGISNMRMTDNIFDRALYNSILAQPVAGAAVHYWTITGNMLSGDLVNTPGTSAHKGILLSTTAGGEIENIIFNGNVVENFKGRGCHVFSGCRSVMIADNNFFNVGQAGEIGLTVETTTIGVTVSGNTIDDKNGLMTYGIEMVGTGISRALGPNSVYGFVTAAVLLPTIASASTIAPPLNEGVFLVSGTTNIDTITASFNGARLTLVFSGILTVNDASNLKLAGNFTTSADDVLNLVCNGTNWYEVSRSTN